MKPNMITIEFSLLKKIARYYEFPIAVFLLPANTDKFPKKSTRYKKLIKDYEKFKKIKELFS